MDSLQPMPLLYSSFMRQALYALAILSVACSLYCILTTMHLFPEISPWRRSRCATRRAEEGQYPTSPFFIDEKAALSAVAAYHDDEYSDMAPSPTLEAFERQPRNAIDLPWQPFDPFSKQWHDDVWVEYNSIRT